MCCNEGINCVCVFFFSCFKLLRPTPHTVVTESGGGEEGKEVLVVHSLLFDVHQTTIFSSACYFRVGACSKSPAVWVGEFKHVSYLNFLSIVPMCSRCSRRYRLETTVQTRLDQRSWHHRARSFPSWRVGVKGAVDCNHYVIGVFDVIN